MAGIGECAYCTKEATRACEHCGDYTWCDDHEDDNFCDSCGGESCEHCEEMRSECDCEDRE